MHAASPGRPTNRRVLALALPMTVANVTTPMLGFVGAAVIGRLGDAALLGAIALGAVIFDAIFWSFGALRMATAGLTAQAVGGQDEPEVDRILAGSATNSFPCVMTARCVTGRTLRDPHFL